MKKKCRLRIMQGPIQVSENGAWVAGSDCAAICVDLRQKYASVESTGSDEVGRPVVCVGTKSGTLYVDKRFTKYDLTEITFLDYAGWDVFCANIYKCTLYVCLTRY